LRQAPRAFARLEEINGGRLGVAVIDTATGGSCAGVARPSRHDSCAPAACQLPIGLDRLRKDLPAGWRAADKTGSNGAHTSNDIAVMWPKDRQPVIVAAYITQCPGPDEKRATMLANIGRLVEEAIS